LTHAEKRLGVSDADAGAAVKSDYLQRNLGNMDLR